MLPRLKTQVGGEAVVARKATLNQLRSAPESSAKKTKPGASSAGWPALSMGVIPLPNSFVCRQHKVSQMIPLLAVIHGLFTYHVNRQASEDMLTTSAKPPIYHSSSSSRAYHLRCEGLCRDGRPDWACKHCKQAVRAQCYATAKLLSLSSTCKQSVLAGRAHLVPQHSHERLSS